MNSSGPTEADLARAAGYGNWVDRVAELEKELQDYRGCALHGWRKRDDKIERLEAENARLRNELDTYLAAARSIAERHPIASVKHIGLREIDEAVKQVFADLVAESQRMSEMWTLAGKRANAAEDRVKELEAGRDEVEEALYETVCQVAAALGLTSWGNEELGPAVAKLKDENIRLRLLQQPGFCNVCLAHAPNKAGQCLSCMTEAELQTAKERIAELEAENAKQKADHAAEAKRWETEFNQQDAELERFAGEATATVLLQNAAHYAKQYMPEGYSLALEKLFRKAISAEREACAKQIERLAFDSERPNYSKQLADALRENEL